MTGLRDATASDAAHVGEVLFATRAEVYPAFLPPDRVNWRTLAERQKQWCDFLADPGYGLDRFMVVFEAGGAVVGFAGGGPQRHGDPAFPAEIWSLYLRSPWRGRGFGRRLISEMARRFVDARLPALIVWTQGPNAPARGFYERLGGTYVRSRVSGGIEVVGYGWPDLRALL